MSGGGFRKFSRNVSAVTSFSHRLTAIVATLLPMKFVIERHSLMKRSMPSSSATDSMGIVFIAESVAARVTKPAPVTPLAPFEVIIATSSRPICWRRSSGVFVACARKIAAIAM